MVRKIGMSRPAKKSAADSWEDYMGPGEKLL